MALTTLKIAVVAPMPSARVRIATPVEVAFFHSMRAPKRRSCRKDSMRAALLAVDLVSETKEGTLWQVCLFRVIVHRALLFRWHILAAHYRIVGVQSRRR